MRFNIFNYAFGYFKNLDNKRILNIIKRSENRLEKRLVFQIIFWVLPSVPIQSGWKGEFERGGE